MSQTVRKKRNIELFFIVGPLRTGSSLMARCIDDHENVVCLCESEINRTLYKTYYLQLHAKRMRRHGFSDDLIYELLDRKKQDDWTSLIRWYTQVLPHAARIMNKPNIQMMGDKSPDFCESPELVDKLINGFRLVYTTRDPRAILRSIHKQDQTDQQKKRRWTWFQRNIRTWREHLDRPNVLLSRYEDLVSNPLDAMARVYEFLGLPPSTRFMEGFDRLHPKRFLWVTAIDWNTGARKEFDVSRIQISDDDLAPELLPLIYDDPDVVAFMERFGYLPGSSYTPPPIKPLV